MSIIAICRGTKTYGTELAECLAECRSYPIVGEEVVRDAAATLGVTVEDLQERMSGRPTMWSGFSGMRRTYLLGLKAALAERIVEGRLVYHGVTGGLLLNELPATLTVRCLAPMEVRVRAVMAQSEMSWVDAERYIRDLDEARSRWAKVIHNEDITDPSLYDVVVNLEQLTVAAACEMICEMLDQPEFQYTDEVRERLRDFLIESRVELALVEDEELRSLKLEAAVESGRVEITGTVPAKTGGQMGERIAEAARTVPDVDDVNLRVEWFDPYP